MRDRHFSCAWFLFLIFLYTNPVESLASVTPVNLRCQYTQEPLGVDGGGPIRLSWELVANDVSRRGTAQTSFLVLIASQPDILSLNIGDVWDSGRVISKHPFTHVDGSLPQLLPNLVYFWKVMVFDEQGIASTWSQASRFSSGFYSNAGWKGKYIGVASLNNNAAPWVRATFSLTSQELSLITTGKAALLAYAGSVGYHELYLNGKPADHSVLSPSTSYMRTRILYRVYDVTALALNGDNVLAVWIGPGWGMFIGDGETYDLPKYPLLIAELHLVIFGNSEPIRLLASDMSWKVKQSSTSHLGKWTNSDFGGDIIDMRLSLPSWNTVLYDDKLWENATIYTLPGRQLSADLVEPNFIFDQVKAESITEDKGVFVITMAELFTGWIQLTLPANTTKDYPCGSNITISISTNKGVPIEFNMQDVLILDCKKVGDPVIFCNRFSYHEIHYLNVTGLVAKPNLVDVVGFKVGNRRRKMGDFQCSNTLLNQIYNTTLNTYEGLTTGGMTVDCPHRERLGYGGDSHTTFELAMSTYPSGAIYTKFARDWADVQNASGYMPHTAPTFAGGGGPAWPGFSIVLPWHMYLLYGDVHILHYMLPHMKNLLSFFDMQKDFTGLMQTFGGYWGFLGDWVSPHGSELSDTQEALLFNNCYLVYCLRIVANISLIMGNQSDAIFYSTSADKLSAAIHTRFWKNDLKVYIDARQTHLVMPLIAEVSPPELRQTLIDRLVLSILEDQKGHLDTGLHGTYFMTKFLTMINRNDLITTYALQTTFPGYGDILAKGYTTWPEEWGGSTSRMHGCLNGIGLWFQQGLAGLRALSSTYWSIRPGIDALPIEWAKATSLTVSGNITISWQRLKQPQGILQVNITIAPSIITDLYLPGVDPTTIFESGIPASNAKGVVYQRMEPGGWVVFSVVSGNYFFLCKGMGL